MKNLRLFDRIRSDSFPVNGSEDTSRLVVDSVVSHLRQLLNTQQGTTLMDPFYGMPEFADLRAGVPDSVQKIEKLISNVVKAYEPRLRSVSVSYMHQDEQLILYFQIKGVLDTKKGELPVYLESIVDTCGKMDIRK
ncbi:MAG: type VI secretion system baseplate subunit TssE [Desulfobacteraceae bacterium]|jgi:type VI secretion system protein